MPQNKKILIRVKETIKLLRKGKEKGRERERDRDREREREKKKTKYGELEILRGPSIK